MLFRHHSRSAWLPALLSSPGRSLAQGGRETGKWGGRPIEARDPALAQRPRAVRPPPSPHAILHDASDLASSTWAFRETVKTPEPSRKETGKHHEKGAWVENIQIAMSHCQDARHSFTEGGAPKGQDRRCLPNIQAWHVLGCVPLGGMASPSPTGLVPDPSACEKHGWECGERAWEGPGAPDLQSRLGLKPKVQSRGEAQCTCHMPPSLSDGLVQHVDAGLSRAAPGECVICWWWPDTPGSYKGQARARASRAH